MTEMPEIWDEEADVVVIGYGFAGATAAITACDSGAKVLLLEKAPERHKGGNSRVSANIVFWPDDIPKAEVYFKALAGAYLDNIPADMIHVWATEMYANKAWLEQLGMAPVEVPYTEFPEFDGADCVHGLMHGPGPVGGERLWHVIERAVAARAIDIHYQTPAIGLIRSGHEIIGVFAERAGRRIAIRANRAVVLTCGGFENNPAMIRTFIDGLPNLYPVGTPYNTGDGIAMACAVGAELWHMRNLSGPMLAFKVPALPVAQWLNLPHGKSYLFVGKSGTRFTMEGQPCSVGDRHGKVKRNGVWVEQRLPTPIHMIFDETYRKSGPIAKAHAGWDVSHGNHYEWSDDNLREIHKGWIKIADTLEELALLIGVHPAALIQTVQDFDCFAERGIDRDWARQSDRMAALETAPYYALELTPALINTQGGPRRNKHAQIMATDGEAIKRLYSAGELGSIYSFLYQAGGNIGECFAFGRIAGTNAADETPWQAVKRTLVSA